MKKNEKKWKIGNDFNLPLEDYNFLYDYNNEFFEETYPRMWKNVALYVENHYWKEIEKKHKEWYDEVFIKWKLSGYEDPKALEDLTRYLQLKIFDEKVSKAGRLMTFQLNKYGIKLNEKTYITTQEERDELNRIALQKAKETFNIKIIGNWLKIHINRSERKTIFQYKDWEVYEINISMYNWFKRVLLPREIEIIENCIEAGLFYKYIWAIFWKNRKVITRVLKEKFWATNVFLSPQKDFKKSPTVKVLDSSWYFVIEEENRLYNKSQKND